MADNAHVEDVTQLAADGAEHGSDSGEDVPALVAPAAAAEAANEDDTGSNMGSNVGSNAGSDREDDALLGGGGADEDDDGPSVDEEIARALEATGTVEVFTTALPAMCYLLGVTYLTMALLGNQIIQVGGVGTNFALTGGASRVQAAAAYADLLLGTGMIPAKFTKQAIASAVYTVVEMLYAPHTDAPQRGEVTREGSPDTGFIRKALAVARAVKETTTSAKESSADEMDRLAGRLAPLLGHDSNGVADLAAPSQTKTIKKEIQECKRIPSNPSVQPQVIWRCGGDLGVAAPKAEKNKELVAEATTCTLQLRGRWSTLCITVAACIMDMSESDGVTSNREAALGALGMITALKNAHHLVCFTDVAVALEDALDAARSMQNGSVDSRAGFAAAFVAGARVITDANRLARRDAAKGDAAKGPSAPKGGSAGPMTMNDLRELLKDKSTTSNKGKPNATDKTGMKAVKLANGKTEHFERKKGGNPRCPVKCTKDHAKETWCHFSHADK